MDGLISYNHRMQGNNGQAAGYRLAIGLTVLAGIALRLGHLFFIDHSLPFRLGGLFLEFSNQIIASGFRLPVTIPYYSAGGLPFAYPPLAFYVQAALITLFHPDKYSTVNFLPPVVAALSVPSFYYLVKQLNTGRLEAWCMLAAFAFIPNAFLDQIEAAGLPEAFGELALIWYAAFLVQAWRTPGWAATLAAGVLLGLNILASPGSALAAPLISLVYAGAMVWRAYRERRPGLLALPAAVGLIGLVVSAPWWLTVMGNHGRGVFTAALLNQVQTGGRLSFLQQTLDRLLTLNLSSIRNNSFTWSALTFWGMISHLTGPWFHLPILFILFSLVPREGIWLSALAGSLLAGRGLAEVIRYLRARWAEVPSLRRWLDPLGLLVFLVIALYTAFLAVDGLIRDRQWALDPVQAAALERNAAVIPPGAQVIVIGNDALLEWAPQLLQREVVNTPYGLEWQPGELNRVDLFNREVENALTFEDVLTAVKRRLHLQEAWLVTSAVSRFKVMPPPVAGTVETLYEEDELLILRLVVP